MLAWRNFESAHEPSSVVVFARIVNALKNTGAKEALIDSEHSYGAIFSNHDEKFPSSDSFESAQCLLADAFLAAGWKTSHLAMTP